MKWHPIVIFTDQTTNFLRIIYKTMSPNFPNYMKPHYSPFFSLIADREEHGILTSWMPRQLPRWRLEHSPKKGGKDRLRAPRTRHGQSGQYWRRRKLDSSPEESRKITYCNVFCTFRIWVPEPLLERHGPTGHILSLFEVVEWTWVGPPQVRMLIG